MKKSSSEDMEIKLVRNHLRWLGHVSRVKNRDQFRLHKVPHPPSQSSLTLTPTIYANITCNFEMVELKS